MLIGFLRTLIIYAVILASVRIMGKRQISQLQTSELVVTLLISETAVMPLQNTDEPVWRGLLPVGVLVLCELSAAYLMLKSGRFRQLLCGKPVIVIRNGTVLQNEMRRLRMSTEDLFEQLRENGVFTLEEVACAVIETNGTMSVLKRSADDSLTPKQAGVKAAEKFMELVIISDGEISKSSLSLCGRDVSWVNERLKFAGIKKEDVFLMTASPNGKFKIVKKEGLP